MRYLRAMFQPLIALSQAATSTAALPDVGAFSWNQWGPMGAVAGAMLTLFGWVFKRLIDNVLKQNAHVMQLQLTKLDEIKSGLVEMKTAILNEMNTTQTVLNQLNANVVQELEALRSDVAGFDSRARGGTGSYTDTPVPVPRRQLRFQPTPVIGTPLPPRTPPKR